MKVPVLDSGYLRQLHCKTVMKLDPSTIPSIFGDKVAPDGCAVADNFSGWFGNSRVVDEHGAPLVLVHGTKSDFSMFETGHGNGESLGFLFAPKECVNTYIWSFLDANYEEGDAKFFMPVYLSIKHPMFWDTTDTGAWTCPVSENEKIVEAKKRGFDGLIIRDKEAQTMFYVAFEASQIKSAVGNSGDFNEYSDDIVDRHWQAESDEPLPVFERMRA